MSESVHHQDGHVEGAVAPPPVPAHETPPVTQEAGAELPVRPETEERVSYSMDATADGTTSVADTPSAAETLVVEPVAKGQLDNRGRTPAERARLREEIIERSRMAPAQRRLRAARSPHIKALLERMAWRQPPPDSAR